MTALPTTTGRVPRLEGPVLTYWGVSLLIGVPLLWDLLSAWHVGVTLSRPAMPVLLGTTFLFSQLLYAAVARHSGRPLLVLPTLIFALGNGFAETLAFAASFRLGQWLGDALAALLWPPLIGAAGFALGVAAFVLYGGLIHAVFWLPLLPPHLDDQPRSRLIRRLRPIAEIGLVLGWSLCFFLFADIWTVVIIHVFVDVGLMLLVRPGIFTFGNAAAGPSSA